jgi:hypothetical protein
MGTGSKITEVTAPVEMEIVDDRLLFTLTSGRKQRTFSISFHKAANASHVAQRLLADAERGRRIYQLEQRRA